MFALLKNRNYLLFWASQVISQLGDGITRIAITYLVATLSKDPLAIGFVIFAQLLPTAVFGIFLGPIADRYSRKWLMIGSDLYRMVIVLFMIGYHDSVPVLIGLIVLQGFGSAIFEPARSASIPEIVGENNIHNAISLSQGTRAAMDLIGPSIGALLLLLNNYNVIFLLDAFTFLVSALLLVGLNLINSSSRGSQTVQESYLSSITSGIKQVVKMPALRFLLLLLIPVTLVVGILNTNLVAVLTNVFEVSASQFGLLEASFAIGALVGSLGVGPLFLKKFRPSSLLISGTVAIGAWMIVILFVNDMRLTFGIAPVFVWCIIVGILNTLINVPLSSLFLGATPAPFRGRGSSLLGATANSCQMIGILGGGMIAKSIGVLNGTALSGALLILVVIIYPFLKGYKELNSIKPPTKDNDLSTPRKVEIAVD
ncbi:MFS transporter [Fredinandcohnia humi]